MRQLRFAPRSLRPLGAGATGLLGVLLLLAAVDAPAQCLLANPSFELPGSGGGVLAGWNQFGIVGASAEATHGAQAARVSGPNLGGWDVSAFWQALDCAPGEQWSASVRVRVSAAKPLTGLSRAIVNIEWRDAGGGLIDYESHAAADASTPAGQVLDFAVVSGPAPVGTVTTHFLLGVLQEPGAASPDVIYDEATFDSTGPPTLDDLQWADFPGGNTLSFSGRTWRVKGPGLYGPGPNLFCDSPGCAWVDAGERLHLTIRNVAGSWYSTEVVLEEALGYGDYVFTTVGRLDDLDAHTVFGLFIWQYGRCYDPAEVWWNPYNEVDVEFSRWGVPGQDVGQFVAQPYDVPGNLDRFAAAFVEGEVTSHAFRWLPDRVEFRSWRGGARDETPTNLIHAWTYPGWHIPRPEQPRVHLNLWQFDGPPAIDQEVVLEEFRFFPMDGAVDVPPGPSMPAPATGIVAAWPNPFRFSTTIRYSVPRDGSVEVAIHDVTGRLVRRLGGRPVPSGRYEVIWDGRDQSGSPVASGVYLYRLRSGTAVVTQRVVRVR